MRFFAVNAPDFQRGALDGAGRLPCVVFARARWASSDPPDHGIRSREPHRFSLSQLLSSTAVPLTLSVLSTSSSEHFAIVNSTEPSAPPTSDVANASDRRVGPALAVSDELFTELSSLAESQGCSLLHAGRKGATLQLVLDHPDGVTVDHCAAVSREAGVILDAHDYGAQRYVLEVTSPGLDREFYTVGDYDRFTGRLVRVSHRTAGKKATVTGRLESFTPAPGTIVVQTERERLEITLDDISSTRLEIDI